MKIKQVSIFLENKKGRLADLTNILSINNINIRALYLADTTDFGILRLIVDKPEEIGEILKNEGFVANITDVLAVEIADRPGGLADVMAIMERKHINIEYLYAFVQKSADAAMVVFQVDDIENAIVILQKEGITLADSEYISKM